MPVREPAVDAKSQQRRKAPTLRGHDWEPLKTRIVELYVRQNMSLPDVRALMQKERGFEATLRQYRSRISQWGLDKNVKTREMDFIARKYYERQAYLASRSPYAFRVRGKAVPLAKIRRWVERTSTKRNDVTEARASTPSDVSYWSDCEQQASEAGGMSSTVHEPDQKSAPSPASSSDKVDEEVTDDSIRDHLASLVRYRQPSARDSPVSSLQDLYRQQDLSTLLGSLEIDDVLVGPYVADAEANNSNGIRAGFAPDLHTSVGGPLFEFELAQKAEEKITGGKLTSLVQLFFQHAYPFVPVLDKQDFLQRWDLDRESIPLPTRSAIFSLVETLNDAPENALKWFRLARGQLSPSRNLADLSTLQALLILLKAKESMPKENYYFDSWLGISRCIEIAQSLGLSRHTTHQQTGSCDSSVAECRLMRRIWQTIYVVEVMISYPNVPLGTVDFYLGLGEDADPAMPEESQFTQLARLLRSIKELYSTYLVGKVDARLATETEFLRHKSTLEMWLNSLPARLALDRGSEGSCLNISSAFVGHLHAFYCLGLIMLNRVQLPLYNQHTANAQWLTHMLLCHAAAKEQCRLHEAIIQQFGLRGVQCMQRGANFTIYCMLLCVAVHLAALTSPDPRLHSDAADYLVRQMRLLESCQNLWPSPELAAEVCKLRELLSDREPNASCSKDTTWTEDAGAAAYAQSLLSDLLPGDIDESDVNSWIDSFL
ncbi:Transcription factor [Cordyceps fumosorosea ARSEF 2679]|uniref:Transcription factor n=1 Tax=Cordyceps fumosorosea (strain ARSEF 2679) TaxID=1081104 RepID=A0A167P7F6_CORFA|nr:Transcription factor [Cordyceps fumosorosea ARSEF 2679]OAA56370.1 Transcription factor [Cordyceps fumosorosea ARSEF 2679]